MLPQGRTRKKRSRFRKILRIFTLIMLLILVLLVTFYTQLAKRALYVSPLPSGPFEFFAKETGTEQVEQYMREKKIEYSKVSFASNSGFTVILKNGSTVILSDKKDLKPQMSSLQFILSRLTMEGKPFARLDLRFEKPVIVSK